MKHQNTELQFTNEDIQFFREQSRKAKPYAPDEKHPVYFDRMTDRDLATSAMETLKILGKWTEEDERIAFGN